MTRSPLEQWLADWGSFGLPFETRPRLLRQLCGGRTNTTYLIAADGGRWVLRLNARDSVALGINRTNEQRAIAAAARARLAPAVIQSENAHDFLLTEYIVGEHARADELDDDRVSALLNLVIGIGKLHVDLVPIDYRLHNLRYLNVVASDRLLPQAFERRIALIETESALAVCHHDPTPANVIFRAHAPLLLDWEYAALGRPILDLAALVVEWQLALDLVSEHAGVDRELLFEACTLYRDMCALWTAARQALVASAD